MGKAGASLPPMKICMMTNTYLPHVGGVARSVHTFASAYRRLGHRTVVVAPTFPGLEEMDPELERDVVRVPAVQQFNGSDFSVRLPMVAMLDPELLELEVDVIHSHHPFLLGDTALRLGADKQAPVVFTHHTLYEEYIHYVPFSSSNMRQFAIELSTHYANLCNAVIAPSQSIADLIVRRGVQVPVHVIPTGIDVKAFASGDGRRLRRALGIGEEAFVVGTLGRLAAEKNLGFLCRAVGEFLQNVPEAVFLAVGEGPSAGAMREAMAELGVADRLFLPGKMTGQALCDAYGAMDVFAFSSFSETQGLVLAEAMAAGLPVVALDASGVREVLREGENGFMLPAQATTADFSAKLAALHEDRALRETFGAGARATAGAFSEEHCAGKALGLYDQLVRESRPQYSDELDELWNSLLKRIRVEWDLLSEKAAAIGALLNENDDRHPGRD
jgi:1,2-diacylglycerol 3-alpha-glucosyltransferase